MKYDILETENYLLVINDSEINEGDFGFNTISKTIDKFTTSLSQIKQYYKKIIAHLPLNNSVTLGDVDLLPPIEETIMDYMAMKWVFNANSNKWSNNNDEAGDNLMSFKEGYLSSEQRHHKIFNQLMDHLMGKMESISQEMIDKDSFMLGRYRTFKYVFDYIHSLYKQEYPKHFDSLVEDYRNFTGNEEHMFIHKTKNSNGQHVWVGDYVY